MEIFHIKRDIPFMRHAVPTSIVSALTFVAAVFFLIFRGLNLGVDFTGGTLIEVSYPQAVEVQSVRDALTRDGFHDAVVQNFGTPRDILIRLPIKKGVSSAALSEQVLAGLRASEPNVRISRVEFVGPQVGAELLYDGSLALIVVAIGIMLYLALRFEWKFAVGAIIATAHDVVIILGLFAFFQWEFSLTVLAAVLAIFGYSVNESVVVFDRVRENFRKLRKHTVPQIIDNAITRTISRTIITHGSTQLAVLSMLFFGGETLHYFALALTIGILFGIYSSALVASPIVMWLGVAREDLMPVKKETLEDGRP